MAFPATALPVVVELDLAGDGTFSTNLTNVTNSAGRRVVRVSDGITITRGRSAQSDLASPATCRLTVDNSDGRFSPRKPDGPYYGQLRRNTPIRVSVTSDTSWLEIDADTGSTPAGGARVTAPDSAGLSITGDLDIQLDADLDAWRGTSMDLIGKWGTSGNNSYILVLESTGQLGLFWSTNGTNLVFARSDAVVPRQLGRLAVRATLDVNNGAAGNTTTFYTSDSITGGWTQLGTAQTNSGTTSIFDSTTDVTVLDTASGSQSNIIRGRVFGARIYQGIAGTLRASPDFTAQAHAASSFADAQGNTWTLTGDVRLTTRDVRFVGEVSQWPVTWDLSQRNVRTEIEASGILRRLQQGARPLASTMRQRLGARTDAVAYWPMEDAAGSGSFGSALANGKILKWTEAVPNLASDSQFVCSDSLPAMNGSRVTGVIPYYSHTGVINLQFLMYCPADTVTDTMLVRLSTARSRWDIRYTDASSGSLNLQWFDSEGTLISSTGAAAFGVDDLLLWMSLELTQDGADVDYKLALLEVGELTGFSTSGTATGVTLGRATAFRTGHIGHDPSEVFGHVIATSSIYSIYDVADQLNAYNGEYARERIRRLCEDAGVPISEYATVGGTHMGYQRVFTVLDLIRQAEDSDAGILFEPRNRLGLAFRSRRSMHTQTPTLSLSYTGRTLTELQPVEDDTSLRNDVVVSRIDGSSVEAQLTSGALSIQSPPDGVGAYPTSYSLNLENDLKLEDHAHWRLALGTVDEARYPSILLNLAAPAIAASASTTAAVRRMDVGDRIVITDPPSGWLAPDSISLLAVGFTEILGPKTHVVEINCVPENPYRVAVFNGSVAPNETRYNGAGTVTTEALDTTETGVDVTCPTFVTWGIADGDFNIVLGGEVMTVTNISGSGPTYTFTVIRSVNGIVKSHSTGAAVQLADPRRYGLI
jgi:hypothetical protein